MTLGLYTPSAVALVVLAQWPQATEIVNSRRCSKNVSRISWASPASLLALLSLSPFVSVSFMILNFDVHFHDLLISPFIS